MEMNNNLSKLNNWAQQWLIAYNPDKTEAVIFSLKSEMEEVKQIKHSENHKHLGLTLSSDSRWSCHISNVIKITSRMISSLRKMKYLLNRKTLNIIYKVFIRANFKQACEIWDECTFQQSDKVEKLQLEAARIVTGLPSYVSRSALYFETGWEPLAERRRKRKLCLFYKMYHGLAPSYLIDLLPENVGSKSSYTLRNSDNIQLPFTRIKHSYESFCHPQSECGTIYHQKTESVHPSQSLKHLLN